MLVLTVIVSAMDDTNFLFLFCFVTVKSNDDKQKSSKDRNYFNIIDR